MIRVPRPRHQRHPIGITAVVRAWALRGLDYQLQMLYLCGGMSRAGIHRVVDRALKGLP